MLKTNDQYNWNLMSDVGSNQLTSVYSKIIRKPINPSRKKKSLHFGHNHETKLGGYANKSRLQKLSNQNYLILCLNLLRYLVCTI